MWVELGLFVASMVVSYFTRPKVKYDTPKPGKFEVGGGAQAGGEIPVLFGSREINAPKNILWWGDVKTKAIKKSGGKK